MKGWAGIGFAWIATAFGSLAAILRVPGDHATVQAALNAAQPGDVVLLSARFYDEAVASVRGGTADRRIVLDGQGQATLKQFTFRHPYITVQNLAFTGVTQAYSRLVYFGHGGHFGVLSNCVLDARVALRVYGIEWQAPRVKPFGEGEVASHCLIISNEIRNVLGITMASIMGDSNRIIGNLIRDGGAVDFFRLFGRHNYLAYNVCSNNYIYPGVGNHPDFIQTFGNNGDGSMGHVIEGNWVVGVWGGQLTQLEGNLVPEIRNWTFRNNVFIDIALQASCTMPEVKYYNNLFLRCNKTNGGHALTFGSRYYASTYGGRSGTNSAHGCQVINNIFLDCGDARNTVGWYSFGQELTNVLADYNYVAKAGFAPVEQDPMRRPVGNPGGWATWGKWWEPNGINGGDPRFVELSRRDFRLRPDSPLIGRGLNLSKLFRTDILGRLRYGSWDIGPYVIDLRASALAAPPEQLRIIAVAQ
ncbi:MAG: hypothetical protein RMN51_01730 [Verrucomicrobiota bacterium]|nr:hypothetical protein [Limisphaera sp.]MDW8380819.1 hypothetical protein [Verrucomicrobiota bacterium]